VVNSWGGPDILQLPHFMAIDSRGVLYVAEVNGKRVQKFVHKGGEKTLVVPKYESGIALQLLRK
jgi:hypothetical protein